MTGTAYATSAEMAGWMGAFPGYADNRDAMLRVIRNHRRAAHSETAGYEGLAIRPQPLDAANCPDAPLVEAAKRAWDKALALGEQHGFRNAQVSVIAPTGTIGLVMDCDTTGIEPDFALVKFKKLAGGGYFKIINRTVPLALETLGYDAGGHRAHRRPRRRPWLARRSARDQSRDAGGTRLRPGDHRACGKVDRDLLRYPLRLLALHLGRSLLPQRAGSRRRSARRSQARRAVAHRILQERYRRGERSCVRDDEHRRRARSQARASLRVRLCESLWTRWHSLLVCRESHTHDGCSPAVRIGRNLQDHQHAKRSYGRGLPQGL